jgi:predicted AlkP superfamily phosphohydrolase/phosphomutase
MKEQLILNMSLSIWINTWEQVRAWGVEFPSLIVQDNTDEKFQVELGINKRLFSIGSNLVRIEVPRNLNNWSRQLADGSEYEIDLSNWGTPLWAAVTQNTDHQKKLKLSFDRKQIVAEVLEGEWSQWIPITLNYELKNDYQKNTTKKSQLERDISSIKIETAVKVKPIYLSDFKKFRIRLIYDGLNDYMSSPMQIAAKMKQQVGPMVDYVDSFPPQLIHFLQDRDTFLEEADMSWQWHKKVVPFLVDNLKSDVVIHSIYSPNQMLTSRWWLPFVDPQSKRYSEISEEERRLRWSEVKRMYRQADDILGEIIVATEQKKDEDWYIILSSDHGVVPLFREVRLNNLFAQKGWLKYKYNKVEKEYEIDWQNTKVVFLQMNNIYINPEGLGGVYSRSSSPEYFQLRDQVRNLLKELKDTENGTHPLFEIWNYEEAARASLYADRVGDLVIANTGQYSWVEDVSQDNQIFVNTKKGGYKQAVWPKSQEGMLTPFVVAGPGINKKCRISKDIAHVDQLATIQKIMNFSIDHEIQGKPVTEIFE